MTATYEVALVLIEGDKRRPVVATVTAGATVAELAQACGCTTPLFRHEQRLDPDATLLDAGVMSGDELGVGAAVAVDWRQLGHELRVVGGRGAGLRRRVGGRGLVVGRGDDADVVIADPRLSRRHVEVCLVDDGFSVCDLGSRNGVVVEGRTTAAHEPVICALGTAVRVGDVVFSVAAPSDNRVTLRRADPFHLAFVGGRAPRWPDKPEPPAAAPSSALPPRRALLPYVVPSAGALAITATASGAPPGVTIAATPAALLAAVGVERTLQARHARRSAAAAEVAERAEAEVRHESLVAYARAARVAAPDPAGLLAAAEHRVARTWSTPVVDLRLRVGLRAESDGVLLPTTVALGHQPLVLAGPEPVLDDLLGWLVVQAVASVSPRDLDVVVVSGDAARWAWTAWLPHRAEASVLPAGATPADLPPRRAARRLVVLDRADSSRWAGDPALGAEDLFIWRRDHEDDVPYHAACVVSAAGAVTLRVEDERGVRDDVLTDACHDPSALATRCGLALARLRTPFASSFDPRAPIGLTDVVPALASVDGVLAAWRDSAGPLRAVIGVDESGPLVLTLDGQNSHALVAGTTGSGKTRLLETLVLALAATRPPDELNVLVIDFKGGNELAALARLPHCVGIVSDRDVSDVDRAISALTREIARRDEVFAAAGASDLADYAVRTGTVLPRLVVIADEFGQFRRDDSAGDRVATLLRVAAQGRSKGLHLVLATQSPSTDVTPEIRQNVGVRVCLRVSEAGESVAVVGVADAARLPGPGHVIVACDNEMRTGRVATAHAPVEVDVAPVRIAELADAARAPVDAATTAPGRQLDDYVDRAQQAAQARGSVATVLLPPPLADEVARRALPHARRPWSVAGLVVGQRDRPGIAEPPPFAFDPRRDGALTIVGGTRSGRTTTLLAIAEAARDQGSGDPLAVHAVAWAPGLEALEGTVGESGVVRRGDFDHLRRTVAWLAGDSGDHPTRLVLVDRLDLLLRDIRELDGGLATQLLEVLNDGPRHRIATAATTEPSALLTGGVASLAGRRFVLAIDDPAVAAAVGLPRRAQATPGRGIAANGDDVQIGLPAEAASARTDLVEGAVSSAEAGRVERMPQLVPVARLGAVDGERVAIGLGGRARLAPVVVNLDDAAPVIVVIGRPGSGRSAALDAFAQTYAGRRRVVRVGAYEASPWSPAEPPSLLIVDDAARATPLNPFLADEALPESLRANGHVAVIAFDQADLTGVGYRHWLTRRTWPGLLLALDATPDRIVAGERLGFLPPSELRAGPVGRGWWCWRGTGTPVQVAAI